MCLKINVFQNEMKFENLKFNTFNGILIGPN